MVPGQWNSPERSVTQIRLAIQTPWSLVFLGGSNLLRKVPRRSKRTATRNSEAPRTNFRRQASYFFKKSSVRVTSRFMQITGREFEATHKLPPLTGQYLEAMKYSPARFLTIVATHPTATGLYDRERRLIRAKFSLKRRNITRKRAPWCLAPTRLLRRYSFTARCQHLLRLDLWLFCYNVSLVLHVLSTIRVESFHTYLKYRRVRLGDYM